MEKLFPPAIIVSIMYAWSGLRENSLTIIMDILQIVSVFLVTICDYDIVYFSSR